MLALRPAASYFAPPTQAVSQAMYPGNVPGQLEHRHVSNLLGFNSGTVAFPQIGRQVNP